MNDNNLIHTCAAVGTTSSTLTMPNLTNIKAAMAEHPLWATVITDPELEQLLAEAEEVRRTYTAVSDLRWAYEKVLLRFYYLLCDTHGQTLRYEIPGERGTFQLQKLKGVVEGGSMDVYVIRFTNASGALVNEEYHENITRTLFDAIQWRLRGIDLLSPWGWPSLEVFHKYKQDVKNEKVYTGF